MIYDLAVIGAGAAGLRAALSASDARMSVVLFDKETRGVGAAFSGSVSMDSLLSGAMAGLGHAESSALMLDNSQKLSKTMEHHIKTRRIEYIKGKARAGHYHDGIFRVLSENGDISARRLIIATGSVAALPYAKGIQTALNTGMAVTDRTLQTLSDIKGHVLVHGGSLRSIQLASYAALCGAMAYVMSFASEFDSEVAALLCHALSEIGVRFIPNSSVTACGSGGFCVSRDRDGATANMEAETLICGGERLPATRSIGLDKLGIAGRRVSCDFEGKTGHPEVFAAGDCAGRTYTLPEAQFTADICARSAAGRRHPFYRFAPEYALRKPFGVFSIGDTAASGVSKRIRVAEMKLPLPWKNHEAGMIKLVADASSRRLLGAHIIGDGAEELAAVFTPSIQAGSRLGDVRMPMLSISSEIASELLYRLNRKI